MFFASLATLLIAATATQAGPLVPRGKPNCVTVKTGYLSADVQGRLKSFTTTSNNYLSYKGDGKNPLYVEFQACLKPGQHLGSGGGGGTYTGRLFVPSVGKCVDVPNQADAPPYYANIGQCQETAPDFLPIVNQNFIYLSTDGDNIYFLGKTFESGSPQGNCPEGYVGYEANLDGVPALTKDGQVFLGCYNQGTQSFRLSPKAQ